MSKQELRWLVGFLALVAVMLTATAVVVSLLVPHAKWGIQAWPLYFAASALMAWVILDIRAAREKSAMASPVNNAPLTEPVVSEVCRLSSSGLRDELATAESELTMPGARTN